MEDRFEIRDARRKEMFRMDDEYLNGYARLCGVNATVVYLCLCRHASRDQESFPSVNSMAEKTGISRDSVMRGIKILEEWHIISKHRERRANATWLNNSYTLMDKSVWKAKPSRTEQLGAKSHTATIQVANGVGSQVAQSDTKVSHKKDTHIVANTTGYVIQEDTPKKKVSPEMKEVFSLFTGNPEKAVWGTRVHQREAAAALHEEYGIENLRQRYNDYQKYRPLQYCPQANSPAELLEKMGRIEKFILEQNI